MDRDGACRAISSSASQSRARTHWVTSSQSFPIFCPASLAPMPDKIANVNQEIEPLRQQFKRLEDGTLHIREQ